MEKLRVREVVVVEGRYDAAALQSQIDGLVITTGGFSIFTDQEKTELIRRLGRQRGLLILTDSDAAGFRIRHYIEKIAGDCPVKNAYIPALPGKERRKQAPSREGLLGVEGMPAATLREALLRAGIGEAGEPEGEPITYTDLYELGISGGAHSAQRRRQLARRLGLPPRLSKRALVQVLSSLYTKQQLYRLAKEKPVLFWDFHGTLTHPDVVWFAAAMEAAAELAPGTPLDEAVLRAQFSRSCLPWFEVENGDTRHLSGSEAWWAFCEEGFAAMFARCGFDEKQAALLAGALREKVLQPQRYTLYPDVLPTLRRLKEQGYKSYILSNNFPELGQLVRALGLEEVVEGVITSGQTGYEKPRREMFEQALAVAGHPARAYMIGDNPHDDIAGGSAAGLATVAVHGINAPGADYKAESIAGVLDILIEQEAEEE